MAGWLLNIAYLVLIVLVSPLLAWQAVRRGKYRRGWREKLLGRLPVNSDRKTVVWFHAVSVGEVLQLRTIVPRLRASRPECNVLITTTTSTGHTVAQQVFSSCQVAYVPLDFTWAVRNAFECVRPTLLALVELELWPNLVCHADAAGVPVVLINGRISERSYRGYRRIRWVIRPVLRRLAALGVQTDEYAARLIELGAPAERVTVTGSVKFDGVRTDRDHRQAQSLRNALGISNDERVFIAGSTHDPEERVALDAYLTLRGEFPELRLVLVPRHAERFDEVAKMVERRGVPLLRRSQTNSMTSSAVAAACGSHDVRQSDPSQRESTRTQRPVCLLDTLGELSACWGLADVAFVGGSLTARGGQNMIEPAAYGAAVIVGPHTSNFCDAVQGLHSHGGLTIINAPDELTGAVRALLENPDEAKAQGLAAQRYVLAQQGATDRTVRLLTGRLPPSAHIRAA